MKVWITRRALTQGVIEAEAVLCKTPSGKMIEVGSGFSSEIFHKPYWHTSREAALDHAEDLRQRRVVALHKELKKLRALKFK
jgi:hypothetical protein